MKDYQKLKVWEEAHLLALAIYKATVSFPATEIYGLTSQMRRASVSIPSNLAEGCGRSSDTELSRFVQIALGSCQELEYQVLLAYDLHYLDKMQYEKINDQVDHVRRMLILFLKKTKRE